MLLSTLLGLNRAATDAALYAANCCCCCISCCRGTGAANNTSARSIFLFTLNFTASRKADGLHVLLLLLLLLGGNCKCFCWCCCSCASTVFARSCSGIAATCRTCPAACC